MNPPDTRCRSGTSTKVGRSAVISSSSCPLELLFTQTREKLTQARASSISRMVQKSDLREPFGSSPVTGKVSFTVSPTNVLEHFTGSNSTSLRGVVGGPSVLICCGVSEVTVALNGKGVTVSKGAPWA